MASGGGVGELQAQIEQLKQSVSQNSLQDAQGILQAVKRQIASSRALPPFLEPSSAQQQEITLAREALEQGVMLATKIHDDSLFERCFVQLKPFYTDARHLAPESQNELVMVGLNLLRLLVQNRVAEFHTEVELIPQNAQASPYISHPLQLERSLTEGAYAQVLNSHANTPSDIFKPLMDRLESTVQAEITSCCEASYDWLPISRAKTLLKLDGNAELQTVANERGWRVESGYVVFSPAGTKSASGTENATLRNSNKQQQMPTSDVINQTLLYARELERIV